MTCGCAVRHSANCSFTRWKNPISSAVRQWPDFHWRKKDQWLSSTGAPLLLRSLPDRFPTIAAKPSSSIALCEARILITLLPEPSILTSWTNNYCGTECAADLQRLVLSRDSTVRSFDESCRGFCKLRTPIYNAQELWFALLFRPLTVANSRNLKKNLR
jgi:hypothetical protein